MSPSAPGYLQDHICIHSNELQLSTAFYSINKRPIYHFPPTPKASRDKDRNNILPFWRWNIMTCSHSPRSWSSVSLHKCIFPKLSGTSSSPLCGRCGSFPSLPCREPTSSPLMWLRCIAALHFIMSLLITYPVLGNVLWWPSNIQALLQGFVGGQAYIWRCYAVNEPEMLDIIKPRLGVSL